MFVAFFPSETFSKILVFLVSILLQKITPYISVEYCVHGVGVHIYVLPSRCNDVTFCHGFSIPLTADDNETTVSRSTGKVVHYLCVIM